MEKVLQKETAVWDPTPSLGTVWPSVQQHLLEPGQSTCPEQQTQHNILSLRKPHNSCTDFFCVTFTFLLPGKYTQTPGIMLDARKTRWIRTSKFPLQVPSGRMREMTMSTNNYKQRHMGRNRANGTQVGKWSILLQRAVSSLLVHRMMWGPNGGYCVMALWKAQRSLLFQDTHLASRLSHPGTPEL